MRSPSTAPPVNGLLGSTATTPTVFPRCPTPRGNVRHVGRIAAPWGRDNRQERGHLVHGRPVSGAQPAKGAPCFIRGVPPLAGLDEPIARLVEFFAFDDRVGRWLEAE